MAEVKKGESKSNEKWWLEMSLLPGQRDNMTEMQRGERKMMLLNHRIAAAEKKLTKTRQRRLYRIFDMWVRGEAFRELTHDDAARSGGISLKRWLRQQFVDAVNNSFKGHSVGTQIEGMIREQVGVYLHTHGGRGEPSKFGDFVQKIVRDEVRKLIMDSISIEATIKGTVHSPAKGQRALNLGDTEWTD